MAAQDIDLRKSRTERIDPEIVFFQYDSKKLGPFLNHMLYTLSLYQEY